VDRSQRQPQRGRQQPLAHNDSRFAFHADLSISLALGIAVASEIVLLCRKATPVVR
jgi:hypothetical protein